MSESTAQSYLFSDNLYKDIFHVHSVQKLQRNSNHTNAGNISAISSMRRTVNGHLTDSCRKMVCICLKHTEALQLCVF